MDQKPEKGKKIFIKRHFIFIEVPLEVVWPQVIRWEESEWWPKLCLFKFVRKTPGELQVGTKFIQKMVIPLMPHSEVEIVKLIPEREIELAFNKGMFKGFEIIRVEDRANGTRVEYELQYEIPSVPNKILWKLFCQKLFDQGITIILSALKDYVVKSYRAQ